MKAGICCQLSSKMERFFVIVLVVLAAAAAATPSVKDNARTFEEVFMERYHSNIHEWLSDVWSINFNILERHNKLLRHKFSRNLTTLPLTKEILDYLKTMQLKIFSKFASDLRKMTVQSIYQELNDHCGEYLEAPIVDLRVEASNLTCVTIQLRNTLILKLKMAIDVALQKFSLECLQKPLPLCKKVHANCTTAYEEQTRKLLGSYIEEATEVLRDLGSTPLEISVKYLTPSIEPFEIRNLVRAKTMKEVESIFFCDYNTIQSEEILTWGIVKSNSGRVGLPCSSYNDIYSQDSKEYLTMLHKCYIGDMLKLDFEFMRCAYSDQTSIPLTLLTVPSAYFHSQCLCVAYNGTKCGVTAPQGVDPRLYCLSLLLRDFQKQVSFRPAVTYLDYAFKTRVPVCQFSSLLKVSFKRACNNSLGSFNSVISMQCYFNSLVNKQLNCTETRLVNTYNQFELCNIREFMARVLCEGDGDVEVPVSYYKPGDSPLVLFLTYGDVAVRVLTMVTYLACRQLRNLPGKLLLCYLVTALLRLIVVRATLADMAVAVRLDVATDLSSTLWLTAYLHFLTVSIRDLRLPDSLSPDEARTVLIRSALFGWVLPTALSTLFFWMDEVIDSRVNIGQLLFLICNYVALFANLYMCFKNCSFYYDVKDSAREIKRGARKRDVFAAIFNFAIKTSVLSGAGITIRLIFTQIQGLEQLLGYYHALGTFQGLLVFLLYGCNREARAFWLQVFRSTLHRFHRSSRQNAPV